MANGTSFRNPLHTNYLGGSRRLIGGPSSPQNYSPDGYRQISTMLSDLTAGLAKKLGEPDDFPKRSLLVGVTDSGTIPVLSHASVYVRDSTTGIQQEIVINQATSLRLKEKGELLVLLNAVTRSSRERGANIWLNVD